MQKGEKYIDRLRYNKKVLQMKNYIQHGSVSTYDHVIDVAKMSLVLNRKMHAGANEEELVTGAMLHDYYLYDWHEPHGHLHGYSHPQTAMENASRDFDLTEKEKNIIRSHMWPLTLFHMPASREAWIVCAADKMVSAQETIFKR